MNIGIVDVDGHNFPNFALMKISAWHKSQGDNVEIALPMFDPFGNGCDFFFAPDVMFHFSADEYEAFYARISNAIKKFHEQFNETPRL